MKRYYEIRPVKDKNHTIFDTIRYTAKKIGMPYYIFIERHFVSNAYGYTDMALLSELAIRQVKYPSFNPNQYVANKLNKVLMDYNVPLRISQEA